jgi:hypothetical protein
MEQSQQSQTTQSSEELVLIPQQETPQSNKVPIKKTLTTKKKKGKSVLVEKKRLDLFLEEYEKNGGNGTEAALKVFNTKSRINAATLAQQYLKRASALGRFHLEEKGYGYKKLIDMAIDRMEKEKSPDFVALFDRLMKIGDFADFISKQQPVAKTTINVNGVQKNLFDEYVEGEVIEAE